MELWCALNASSTQKICEVLALYARCHSASKRIAKKFPTPLGEDYKNLIVETLGIAWSYTQTGCFNPGTIGD
jgi:hypothetical protein